MPEAGNTNANPDPVVGQYERWAYPPAVEDLTDPALTGYLSSYRSLQNLSVAYWPAGKPREDLDVLVGGCGTRAAACYAHLYPQCRVVGIDVSRASLQHEQRLKQRHRLDNLTLHHCPLEEVAKLGASFDYISCHGVLHHLSEPATGLRALGGVLRQDGVIAMMLYGKYGRQPIYLFQRLFRLLGLGHEPQDVAMVRHTLAALPDDHPLHRYLRTATDPRSDAGLVDAFLHRRDRPYTVPDCLALVSEAGLVFQGWDQNVAYYPDVLLCRAPAIRRRIEQLPEQQIWQAMEMFSGAISTHWFYTCRSDRDPATYRIPWESTVLLDCIPLRLQSAKLMEARNPGGGSRWAVGDRSWQIELTAEQSAIFAQMDGRRVVRECLSRAGLIPEDVAALHAARGLLRTLWRGGQALLRLPRSGHS